MIKHVVMWKFRPGTEEGQQAWVEAARALQGAIPELLRSEIGFNVGKDNYDAVLISEFEDLDALARYKADPRHVKAAELCAAVATDRIAVDYEF